MVVDMVVQKYIENHSRWHIPDLNGPGEESLIQGITVVNCINIIDILLINRRFALIIFFIGYKHIHFQ